MNPPKKTKTKRQLVIYRHNGWSSCWNRVKTIDVDELLDEKLESIVLAHLPKGVAAGELVLAQWKRDGELGSILVFRVRINITVERLQRIEERGTKDE